MICILQVPWNRRFRIQQDLTSFVESILLDIALPLHQIWVYFQLPYDVCGVLRQVQVQYYEQVGCLGPLKFRDAGEQISLPEGNLLLHWVGWRWYDEQQWDLISIRCSVGCNLVHMADCIDVRDKRDIPVGVCCPLRT